MKDGWIKIIKVGGRIIELDENYQVVTVATDEDIRYSKVLDMFLELDFTEYEDIFKKEYTDRSFDNYEIFDIVFKGIITQFVDEELDDGVEPSVRQIKKAIKAIRSEFPVGEPDRYVPVSIKNLVYFTEKVRRDYN